MGDEDRSSKPENPENFIWQREIDGEMKSYFACGLKSALTARRPTLDFYNLKHFSAHVK